MPLRRRAATYGRRVAIIPAGERWEDGSLRPAFEDLVGASAIIEYLSGRFSPETNMALGAFVAAKSDLKKLLRQCSSGKELIERGYGRDICLASEITVSGAVPALVNQAYVDFCFQSYRARPPLERLLGRGP